MYPYCFFVFIVFFSTLSAMEGENFDLNEFLKSNGSMDHTISIHTMTLSLIEYAVLSNNIDALEILHRRGAHLSRESYALFMRRENWTSFYNALEWLVQRKIIDLNVGQSLMIQASGKGNASAVYCLFRLGFIFSEWDSESFSNVVAHFLSGQRAPFFELIGRLGLYFQEKEKEREYNQSADEEIQDLFLLATVHGDAQSTALILLNAWRDLPTPFLWRALNIAAMRDHVGVFSNIMHHLELNAAAEGLSRHRDAICQATSIAARYHSRRVLRALALGYDRLRPSALNVLGTGVYSTYQEQRRVIASMPIGVTMPYIICLVMILIIARYSLS